MSYFLSPIGNSQILDANGDPLVGGTISTYLANSSTAATTYTSNTGATPQGVVMTLNSLGLPTNGPVWMLGGVPLKFIIKNSSGVTQSTFDNISGIGDTDITVDEWALYGAGPTYISSTSFSVVGDQTAIFQANRRLKTINTGGTVYSTIASSSFGAGITTVNVLNTSGTLDSGLSAVSYGILAATNPSIPEGAFGTTLRLTATQAAARTALAISGTVQTAFKNLAASATGTSATVSVSADEIALQNSSNLYLTVKNVSLSIDGTSAGANGLDAGTIAASTWYSVWVISDGTTTAGLLSTSATAPTMPGIYTYKARVGWVYTDATANKFPFAFTQKGRRVQYKVGAGTNLTDWRTAASGTPGISLVAIAVDAFVPPTAASISVLTNLPNASYMTMAANSTATSIMHSWNAVAGGASSPSISILLESTNIYWACGGASYVKVQGWEDNL